MLCLLHRESCNDATDRGFLSSSPAPCAPSPGYYLPRKRELRRALRWIASQPCKERARDPDASLPPPPLSPFSLFFFLTLSVLRDVFKHTRAGMHECPLGTATCESRHCAVLSTLEPGHVIRQRVCIRMPTQALQLSSRPQKSPAPHSAALHKELHFPPPPRTARCVCVCAAFRVWPRQSREPTPGLPCPTPRCASGQVEGGGGGEGSGSDLLLGRGDAV